MARPAVWSARVGLALLPVLLVVPSGAPPDAVSQLATDPGVRVDADPETPSAGGPVAGVTQSELQLWIDGLDEFEQVETVADGLGPRFNGLSCAECHSQPAVGGTSPAINPQIAAARAEGATNIVPSFVTLDGPVREARFIRGPDGKPDGGVHTLFTIQGRTDAPGCVAPQDDFAGQLARGNVSFRIPTPVFGAGLMEAIPEAALLANQARFRLLKAALGISGKLNRNGNDGRATVFGWKAQNASLLMFAGEAYNVEQGVTSELFPQERNMTPGCAFVSVPNDITEGSEGVHSNVTLFAAFMRFHAPPTPSPDTPGGAPSIARGRAAFSLIGCALCHTPTLTTGEATSAALATQPVPLFSDLLCHDMGAGLADGITQGACGPREFRTAPLWGIGQRRFFLHDGRTADLVQAIKAHASAGSEATVVTGAFGRLASGAQQDVLNFLRSL